MIAAPIKRKVTLLLKCHSDIFQIDSQCSFNNVEVKDKGGKYLTMKRKQKRCCFKWVFGGAFIVLV